MILRRGLFGGLVSALIFVFSASAWAQSPAHFVVNEVDYDQPGADDAEYVEFRVNGEEGDGVVVEEWYLFLRTPELGTNTLTVHQLNPPPNATLNLGLGEYYVVCADVLTVANCDLEIPGLDIVDDTGHAIRVASVDQGCIDEIGTTPADVEECSFASNLPDDKVAFGALHSSDYGEPPSDLGGGFAIEDRDDVDQHVIARLPDGRDSGSNPNDFGADCPTPGEPNDLRCWAEVVINEVDYAQATDGGDFIELYHPLEPGQSLGGSPISIRGWYIEIIDGSGVDAVTVDLISLDGLSLPAGFYYILCEDPATVAACDMPLIDIASLNGGPPSAIALWDGFPEDGGELIDVVSFEGDTQDPYIEGAGTGLADDPAEDFVSIARVPNGIDTGVNNLDFTQTCHTPGFSNDTITGTCVDPQGELLVINEVEYDTGLDDDRQFVEILNVSDGDLELSSFAAALVDPDSGSDPPFAALGRLPMGVLLSGEYFVICMQGFADDDPDFCDIVTDGSIGRGPFGLVLLLETPGSSSDFRNFISKEFQGEIVDAVAWEGDAPEPWGEPGSDLVEDDGTLPDVGISRVPDGTDTDVNNDDIALACTTPGAANADRADNCNCGDGVVDADEVCDDGDLNGTTECGCTAECQFIAVDTVCGSDADTDCDNPDTCDGAGSCDDNFEDVDTACGDDTDDACTAPDTCDTAGVCETNHADNGTACVENGTFCDGIESCDSGLCASPGDPCSVGEGCVEEATMCVSLCGDGALDEGETCDDGNTTAGDGCSVACAVDDGFVCSGEPSVCVESDVDTDGDTILDPVDNCPLDANTDQADLDNDGTGNVCDGDVDGDTILNNLDNCETTENTAQADLDEDGIGDVCDDDLDGDGLSNTEEAGLGTDPGDPDTDNDALSDGREIQLSTNPLDPDTDHGGVPDGEEVFIGIDPLDPSDDFNLQGGGAPSGCNQQVPGPNPGLPLLAAFVLGAAVVSRRRRDA